MATDQEPGQRSGRPSGRVVVGVHGSRSSLRALQHAVHIAQERGWDLEIVTVWPDADDPLIHDVPGRYISPRGRAIESQRAALATLDPVVAADIDTFLVNARPAEALICRSEGADLLVVGAGQPESALGRPSVAAGCVEASPCPVRVVPDSLAGPAERPPPKRNRGVSAKSSGAHRRPPPA